MHIRLKSRPGRFSCASGCPTGATLLVPGLAEALKASIPVVALVQDVHRQVADVVEQMRRGQVSVGGVEELSSSALEALDAIVAATAEPKSPAITSTATR